MTHQHHVPPHHLKRGIFLMLISWFFFASIYLFARLLFSTTNVVMMVFFRNFIALVAIFPWMLLHRKTSFQTTHPKIVLIRALTGLLSLVFVFLAISRISLIDAALLVNTAPLFVPFVVWTWLKKPINHKLWPAIFLGFLGVILILNPGKEILNIGFLFGLIAGLCSAISMLSVRLSAQSEKGHTVLFYFFLIGTILSLPFIFFQWQIPDLKTLGMLSCLGLFAVLGQWFLFAALKWAKISQLAPFSYSAVIYSGIFDWLIFDQAPGVLTMIGTVLIIASGISIIFLNKPTRSLPPS